MHTPGKIFRERFKKENDVQSQGGGVNRASAGSSVGFERGRLVLVAVCLFVVYGAIASKLAFVGFSLEEEPSVARSFTNPLMVARPDLVDRNNEVMAQDLTTISLHADPSKIGFPAETIDRLMTVLPNLDRNDLIQRLNGSGRFVWIERELTPAQQARILDLGIPGLEFSNETSRFYPGGRVASHVVGHVNIDNAGIAGFEKYVDEHWLDHLRAVGFSKNERPEPIQLSIDMRVQHVVRDELAKAIERYQAIAAVGIVMDVETGEVIALSSLPDYDPNHPQETLTTDTLNRATAGVFEMGSTLKTLTTAMALDSGLVSINDTFDARQPISVGRFRIRDFHAKRRVLSVPEVFIYSSNIGTAKMALAVGTEGHRAFLDRMGLLSAAAHELPEIGKPLEPREWKQLSSMTISFGHGVSVTPLQTLSAMAALVNGGRLIPPTFRPRSAAEVAELSRQVISPETSDAMRYLLRLNVEEGSGRRAEVKGYFVGGKTGTAEKVVNRRYSGDHRLNSFLSTFPVDNPRYAMLVMIDEPQPAEGQHSATAGLNTAPTTAAIIRRIATTLGVAPRFNDGLQPITVDYRQVGQ